MWSLSATLFVSEIAVKFHFCNYNGWGGGETFFPRGGVLVIPTLFIVPNIRLAYPLLARRLELLCVVF